MLIDFHTHIYPEAIAQKGTRYVFDFYEFPYVHREGCGTLDHLNRCCAEANADYKVLLAVAVRAANVESINQWLVGCIDEHTVGFGTLHPDYADPVSQLSQFAAWGLKGLKFHPDMQQFNIDDPRVDPIYAWCEQNNMPICFHSGDPRYDYSSPLRLAKVLDKYPGLRVIAAHLGGYGVWESEIDVLIGRKNVYFDTSSAITFLSPERAVEIIRAHGVENVFFGTDYPITTQAEELQRFDRLPLTQSEREAILYKNAVRFLGLDINR